jgi:hypothetical protein
MDAYGLAILGNITVENDNLYVMGGPSNRMANIYSVYFTGIATSSWYADLAEKYSCSNKLPIGTVVAVSESDEAEVERCSIDCDPTYVGVVSKNPGFLMGERQGGLITGLMGKLPVSVVGVIKKKDFIVPTTDGCARAGVPGEEACRIGISLETSDKKESKLVTCIIR